MVREETKPHVMIVEDARDIREPLGRYLREHGYRATTAADALAATPVDTQAASVAGMPAALVAADTQVAVAMVAAVTGKHTGYFG